jgi:acyl-CoA thioesterase-1
MHLGIIKSDGVIYSDKNYTVGVDSMRFTKVLGMLGLLLLVALTPLSWAYDEEELPVTGVTNEKNVVMFLGGSITIGYGLKGSRSYPELIGDYWTQKNIAFRMVNASMGGDHTDHILDRLDATLTPETYMVFLEAGGHDGLNKYPIKTIKGYLQKIIYQIKLRNIKVVLAEVQLPPYFDKNYKRDFSRMYEELSEECNVPLIKLLGNATGNKTYWQDGQYYPTAEGHRAIAKDVLRFLNHKWVMR